MYLLLLIKVEERDMAPTGTSLVALENELM
jgi:hypothetical protein